MNKIESGDDV